MPEQPTGMPAWRAVQLRWLLDALEGVQLDASEQRSLEWLSGWERHIVRGLADVIRKARQAAPPEAGGTDA